MLFDITRLALRKRGKSARGEKSCREFQVVLRRREERLGSFSGGRRPSGVLRQWPGGLAVLGREVLEYTPGRLQENSDIAPNPQQTAIFLILMALNSTLGHFS